MFPVPDLPHFLGPNVRGTEPHGRCMDKNNQGRCADFTPVRAKFEKLMAEMANG